MHAIFSDGVLCDGFIWKYLWDDLAPVVPLAHWHYRGHGRSATPVDPERVTVSSLAEDLGQVRRHLGDPPCVLFGHSLGCQVALEAYRQRPEKVRGLVLLCGSFGNVTSTFHGDVTGMAFGGNVDGRWMLARSLVGGSVSRVVGTACFSSSG